MAAEEEKGEAPAKKKFPIKVLGIVVGIAVVQGAGFFFLFKSMGSGPEPAHGEETHVVEAPPPTVTTAVAEVNLLKSFRVPNSKSGRIYLYDMEISVVVPADKKDHMKQLAEERGGEIADRVARIVRGASDQILKEDDLHILRAQLTEELSQILDEKELIQRVLIPRFVPIPS